MIEKQEAVVVLAKCSETHKTFGIRAEKKAANIWEFTWAFPIKESSAKREGYDHSFVSGNITFSEEYPGCPYCGGRDYTLCSCGHLSCTVIRNGLFTCEWCSNKSAITAYNGEAISAGTDL